MAETKQEQRPCSRLLRLLAALGVVAAALTVAVPGAGQTGPERGEAPAGGTTDYRIGVGDVLRISVWRNPELGATLPVRPDGRLSLPLVGEVEVAGRTPEALREALGESFSRFVTAPAVSVVVEKINSLRVFVTGEVREPGVYDILQPTKLMQALAMAGGLTEYAKKDRVVILRDLGAGGDQRIEVSINDITSGKDPAGNIRLRTGDTVIVP